ncbi:hypothetical protein CGI58_24360 [Vibrio parahaemolyticus]|nr:hypothetical protein CGI58_24360 [Vibrio parahaemolyticus]
MLQPWSDFYRSKPLAFLTVEVMNLTSGPILITSAEVALKNSNEYLTREGAQSPSLSYDPAKSQPVLLQAGERKFIRIKQGFNFEGLAPVLENMGVLNQPYSKFSESGEAYIIHDLRLVNKFNDQLAKLYGRDASFEVLLYTGLKTRVVSHEVGITRGKDMFDSTGSLDWTRFLGKIASFNPDNEL